VMVLRRSVLNKKTRGENVTQGVSDEGKTNIIWEANGMKREHSEKVKWAQTERVVPEIKRLLRGGSKKKQPKIDFGHPFYRTLGKTSLKKVKTVVTQSPCSI